MDEIYEKIRYIAHISDIHIGSSDDRYEEYKDVFTELKSKLDNSGGPSNIAVVVTGDIFHFKNRLSAEDIDTFNYFADTLKDYSILIIPGNHDVTVNNSGRLDLIEPLHVHHKNIRYVRNSQEINWMGWNFYHLSIHDDASQVQLLARFTLDGVKSDSVLLYHGFVNMGQIEEKLGNSLTTEILSSRVDKSILNQFSMAMLGDVHRHMFIDDHIAYAGSLIQQNLSEDTNKGFILWDMHNRSGEFIRVNNKFALVRIDLRGGKVLDDEMKRAIDEIGDRTIRRVGIISEAEGAELEEQANALKKQYGKIDKISQILTGNAHQMINPLDDQIDVMRDVMESQGVSADISAEIIKTHSERIVENLPRKWRVCSLEWNNILAYKTSNYINFKNLHGLAGTTAPNRAGKSSIVDILIFALYGEILRGSKKDIIYNSEKSSTVRVVFEIIGGSKYCITRADERTRNIKIEFTRSNGEEWTNMTESTVTLTYEKVRAVIGSLSDLQSTGLYYDTSADFIGMKRTNRVELLSQLMGLADIPKILKGEKLKLRNERKKLAEIPDSRHDNPKNSLQLAVEEVSPRKAERDKISEKLKQIFVDCYALYAEIDNLEKHKEEYAKLSEKLENSKKELDENGIMLRESNENIRIAKKIMKFFKIPPAYSNNGDYSTEIAEKFYEITKMNYDDLPDFDDADEEGIQREEYEKSIADAKKFRDKLKKLNSSSAGENIPNIDEIIAEVEKNDTISEIVGDNLKKCESPRDLLEYSRELTKIMEKKRNKIKILKDKYINANAAYENAMREEEINDAYTETIISVDKMKKSLAECYDNYENIRNVVDKSAALSEAKNNLQNAKKEHDSALLDNLSREFRRVCLDISESQGKRESKYHFDEEGCESCRKNAIAATAKVTQLEERKNEISEKIANVRSSIAENSVNKEKYELNIADLEENQRKFTEKIQIEIKINSLESQISVMEKSMKNMNKCGGTVSVEEAKANIANILDESNKIAKFFKPFVGVVQNVSELADAEVNNERVADLERKLSEADKIKTMYESQKFAREIREKYQNISDTVQIFFSQETFMHGRLKSKELILQEGIANTLSQMEILKTNIDSASDLDDRIADAERIREETSLALAQSERNIGALEKSISALEEEVQIRDNYLKESKPILRRIKIYETYVAVLGTKGLQSAIIRRGSDGLFAHVNKLLNCICDFTIQSEISENYIELYTANAEGERIHSVDLASGFQSFIISLAIRMSMTRILTASPTFMIIDEGFGVIDSANMGKLCDFLSDVKHAHDFIFVISHVEQIQNGLDVVVPISVYSKNSARWSHVMFGDSDNLTLYREIETKSEEKINNQNAKGKITCECGKELLKKSLSGHKKSKFHINYINGL